MANVIQDRVHLLTLVLEVLTLRGLVEADYLTKYVACCPGC